MLRNITLSADEHVIQQARLRAMSENRTLNDLFREWLTHYAQQPGAALGYDDLMVRLSHIQANAKFSREELNER